ncbi:hypothetical protein K2173_023417 [Erythroxylum novogranatense]|uniref:Uncharacterized protein n=1 Tax=Erythroxylum novogranatense TaxID=1862640 RepID=A0AAV8TW16_9ROSI|nr:hypothetical protein K2173_023417 [Erythroxylum novogranatense]
MSMTRYNSALWEQIELSESYLVSSMLEEATSLASLVIKQICGRDFGGETLEDLEEFYGMMESAGMVLVQSLSQLGRGPQILNQLKENFVSAEIPVEVFHTAVCIQISEGSLIVAQEFIEEFLNKCRYVDGKYYVGAEPELNVQKESNKRYILEIDQYMAIVETYTLALLATALKKVDLAISWIEKAAMPAENKQRQLLYGKKALTDLWQLAFSYQVNPLAVVQPLPPAPRGR